MSEWKEYKLGEVADVTSSRRIFLSEYVTNGIPFYRSKEIIEKAYGENVSTELFITTEKFAELKLNSGAPENGDLLISAVGERAGIPYFVYNDGDFYFKDGNLIWLRNFKPTVDSKFLLYYLNSDAGQYLLESTMIGSAQKALTIIGMKGIAINFPSLSEQQSISAILSSLDNKIDLLRRQNQTLEQLAQTIFKQWFVHYQYPDATSEMEETELGTVPKGWRVSKIGDEVETLGGGTPSTEEEEYWKDGNINWYSPTDLTKANTLFSLGSGTKINEAGLRSSSAKLFPAYSLMMTSRATVGVIAVNTTEACTNQGFITIIPNQNIHLYFLYCWLHLQLKKINNLASGSTFPEISKSDFRSLDVILPSHKIMNDFKEVAQPIFKSIENNQKEIQTLTQLRDSLLPRLMSGRLRVG